MSDFRPGDRVEWSGANNLDKWTGVVVYSEFIVDRGMCLQIKRDNGMLYFVPEGEAILDVNSPRGPLPAQPTTPRESVLSEAAGLITGDRNATYGSPTQNFQDTADVWTVQLAHKLRPDVRIEPHEVAQLMVGLKLVRMKTSPRKRDNYVDLAGYAACGWESTGEDQ